MEQLNKHPDPETNGFYMILGKLHFWGSEYGFFPQFTAIYIPFVSELRTFRDFQINKSIK